MLRTEGVGIVLDPGMTAAWREAGEVWKTVSSRIVTARLRVSGHAKHLPSRKKRNIPVFVTLVSVYAPTFRARAEVKEKFFADLQTTLDGVDERDVLMVVGDFNARVGSSERRSRDVSGGGGGGGAEAPMDLGR